MWNTSNPATKWVEAGYAFARAVPVFVLGPVENGMSHLFQHVRDEAGLLAELARA